MGFIAASLILGAVIAGLSLFWQNIVSFLRKAIQKVSEAIHRQVLGSKISLQQTGDVVTEISRHYSRVEEHWHETTVRKQVPPSEIPKDMLTRVGYQQELDVTKELDQQLLQLQN